MARSSSTAGRAVSSTARGVRPSSGASRRRSARVSASAQWTSSTTSTSGASCAAVTSRSTTSPSTASRSQPGADPKAVDPVPGSGGASSALTRSRAVPAETHGRERPPTTRPGAPATAAASAGRRDTRRSRPAVRGPVGVARRQPLEPDGHEPALADARPARSPAPARRVRPPGGQHLVERGGLDRAPDERRRPPAVGPSLWHTPMVPPCGRRPAWVRDQHRNPYRRSVPALRRPAAAGPNLELHPISTTEPPGATMDDQLATTLASAMTGTGPATRFQADPAVTSGDVHRQGEVRAAHRHRVHPRDRGRRDARRRRPASRDRRPRRGAHRHPQRPPRQGPRRSPLLRLDDLPAAGLPLGQHPA